MNTRTAIHSWERRFPPAPGGTGYQPVPRGNLPRGMAGRSGCFQAFRSNWSRPPIPPGQWPGGTGRLPVPPLARRSEAGFTMAEIAIALGVIAFALIAIIGILPAGLQVQRDNREETIINQDARLLLQAVRSGGRDTTSDLGSFVVSTNDRFNVSTTVNGIPTDVLIRLLSDSGLTHTNVLSAISGGLASRGTDLSFRYQVISTVTNFVGGADDFSSTVLSNQVHELRLRFFWPVTVKVDGTVVVASQANRYVVRTLLSGWHTNGVLYAQEYYQPAP